MPNKIKNNIVNKLNIININNVNIMKEKLINNKQFSIKKKL